MNQLELGQIVTTAGVAEWADQPRSVSITEAILRHQSGDWGQVCPEDWKINDNAVRHGGRVLSEYEVCGRRIWIITERDRSVTTVLFPEEY